MSTSNELSQNVLVVGDNIVTVIPYQFNYFDDNNIDIIVTLKDSNQDPVVIRELTPNTEYVKYVDRIELMDPLMVGETLLIERNVVNIQPVDYEELRPHSASVHEKQEDRTFMSLAELNNKFNRTILFSKFIEGVVAVEDPVDNQYLVYKQDPVTGLWSISSTAQTIDLSDYYTKSEVDQLFVDAEVAWEGYADQAELDAISTSNDYTDQEISNLDSSLSSDISDLNDDIAALDLAKANVVHTHDLDNLNQSGAISGQVPVWNGSEWEPQTPSSGVNDHGLLSGLGDDDHTQYHNDTRGDARYNTKSEITALLSGKSNTGHTHDIADINEFGVTVISESHILGPLIGGGFGRTFPAKLRPCHISEWSVNAGIATASVFGMPNIAGQGTATGKTINNSTYVMAQSVPRLEYAVTTAANNAVAAWKPNSNFISAKGGSYAGSSCALYMSFGPGRGTAANATLRCFAGLSNATGNSSDANPSVLGAYILGVGADSTDTNWQIMTRPNSGAATTKTDTGIPKAISADDTDLYDLTIIANSSGQVYITFRKLDRTFTTSFSVSVGYSGNVPDGTVLMSPRVYYSVGGTSSVIGVNMCRFYCEQHYAAYGY